MELSDTDRRLAGELLNFFSRIPAHQVVEDEWIEWPRNDAVIGETIARSLKSVVEDIGKAALTALSFRPVKLAIHDSFGFGRFVDPDSDIAVHRMASFVAAEVSSGRYNRDVLGGVPPQVRERMESLMRDETPVSGGHGASRGDREQTSGGESGTAMIIIIHGTWARSESWWRNGGGFWNHVKSLRSDLYGGSDAFFWSGGNSDTARRTGADDLYKWAQARPVENLDIIAHSHGGNVSLLAAEFGLKIRKLILLGTPIRTEYLPRLANVKKIENVFSTGDLIQRPGTLPNRRGEGRTLSDCQEITNHRAANDGSGNSPGHSELHEPLVWQLNRLDGLLN